MEYKQALELINSAVNQGMTKGLFNLADAELLIQALTKMAEATQIAEEMSLKQTGPNSFVGGKIIGASNSNAKGKN